MPDVLLLDLEMPGMNGVEVLRALQSAGVDIRAIVFTAFDTDENIFNAVQAGAKGYLLKGTPRDELFRAIRVVNEGGSLLQPIVMTKLLQHIRHERDAPQREPLSPRENDVLRLMARGLQNKEIAVDLVITERTVKFHVSSILAKLGAGNRTEAVTIALQEGLVEK
jgi:two-component system, NarL family, response regulator LiaR